MPYKIKWVVPQRVLSIISLGDINAEDYTTMFDQSYIELDQGIAPVHVITDNSNIKSYPTDLRVYVKRRPEHPLTQGGWIVIITKSATLRRFVQTALTLMLGSKRLRTVESLDAALAFLYTTDPTLKKTDFD
jgi:hypothetical protein